MCAGSHLVLNLREIGSARTAELRTSEMDVHFPQLESGSGDIREARDGAEARGEIAILCRSGRKPEEQPEPQDPQEKPVAGCEVLEVTTDRLPPTELEVKESVRDAYKSQFIYLHPQTVIPHLSSASAGLLMGGDLPSQNLKSVPSPS